MKTNTWKALCTLAFWTLCFSPSTVEAWPFAPGRCTSGTPVREPHAADATGELADAGYEILINGQPLTKLSTTEIGIDETYTWELRRREDGQESAFRGFLVHFTETTSRADLSDIISIGDDSMNSAQVITDANGFPSCGRNNVAAGHMNNWEKQSVGGEIIFDEVGEVNLEISVVAANKGSANRWYYTKYFLSITNTPETENFIPTSNPTNLKIPQYAPTMEPSLFQTENPTLKSSNLSSFTTFPSPIYSISPSVMESNLPSIHPTHLRPGSEYSSFTVVPSVVNANSSGSFTRIASFRSKLCLLVVVAILLLVRL